MRIVDATELNRILEKHNDWVISHEQKGERADLSNCDLTGHNFRNKVLIKAIFRGSILANTDFTSSNCSWADFRKSDISNSTLCSAKFQYATFIHANLENTDLTNACFKNSVFKMTNLAGAIIHNTSFIQARLINIDFSNVTIDDSDLSGALLLNSKNIDSDIWSDVVLSGIITDALSVKDIPIEGRKKYGYSFVLVQPYAIIRTLEIPRKYKQAGLSVLTYFARILEQKYPNQEIGFSINQQGKKVTLIVETDKAHKSIVEATLDLYENVANSNISPEDFMHTPAEILELRTQLRIAETQVSFYKDMMHFRDKIIDDKEKEISRFFKLVEHAHHIVEDPDPEYIVNHPHEGMTNAKQLEDISFGIKLIRQNLHDLKNELNSPVNLVDEIRSVYKKFEDYCNQSGKVNVKEVIEDTGLKKLLGEIEETSRVAKGALDVTDKGVTIIGKLVNLYNKIAAILGSSIL